MSRGRNVVVVVRKNEKAGRGMSVPDKQCTLPLWNRPAAEERLDEQKRAATEAIEP